MMSETGIPEMHASILRSLGFSDRVISGGHQTTAMKSLLRAADETHVWLKRRYPDRDLRLTAARSGSSGRHNAHFIGESEGLAFSSSRIRRTSARISSARKAPRSQKSFPPSGVVRRILL